MGLKLQKKSFLMQQHISITKTINFLHLDLELDQSNSLSPVLDGTGMVAFSGNEPVTHLEVWL